MGDDYVRMSKFLNPKCAVCMSTWIGNWCDRSCKDKWDGGKLLLQWHKNCTHLTKKKESSISRRFLKDKTTSANRDA